MQLGVVLRNMGAQSTRETLVAAARAADALSAVADLWVADHIAIPPDDAEGSDGRYLDPVATLAYLAGTTTRVGLRTAVLVLPYRPTLPTAKWIATVQEPSGGRLRLPLGDPGAARDLLLRYAEAGATRVIHGERHGDLPAFQAMLDRLARVA